MGRRILIDALAARYGGAAYAAIQVARHLAQRPEVAAVTVLARHESIIERGLAREGEVRTIPLASARRGELARRLCWEAVRLPALARRENADAVISMSGIFPRRPRCALVCFVSNPVMYERGGAANLVRRWAVRRTAKAAVMIAPSQLMADLVTASVGGRCAVLPWGVDHSIFSPAALPGDELLCVADFYAHKRHDLVLDAWLCLAPPRPQLRLVGNPAVDPRAHAQLLARIDSLRKEGPIVLEHGLPLARLVDAYRRARAFVLPSEHESFCMPLAESMACGAPALVRDLPSLRDTGGAGARYLDDDDPRHWADALRVLIDDDDEHARARALAIEAAARFSWERFAADLTARL